MAINCEKVYSGTGDQIYPETTDKAVTVLAKNTILIIMFQMIIRIYGVNLN